MTRISTSISNLHFEKIERRIRILWAILSVSLTSYYEPLARSRPFPSPLLSLSYRYQSVTALCYPKLVDYARGGFARSKTTVDSYAIAIRRYSDDTYNIIYTQNAVSPRGIISKNSKNVLFFLSLCEEYRLMLLHPLGAMDPPLPFSFRKDESRNEGGGGGGGGGDYWCSDREVVDAGASGGAGGGRP